MGSLSFRLLLLSPDWREDLSSVPAEKNLFSVREKCLASPDWEETFCLVSIRVNPYVQSQLKSILIPLSIFFGKSHTPFFQNSNNLFLAGNQLYEL